MSSARVAPLSGAAPPRGDEVERLLEAARDHARNVGERIARIELHGAPVGRRLDRCVVVGVSGREVARLATEDDVGYVDARAAWDALQPGPGVGVAVRSLTISADGCIRFD